MKSFFKGIFSSGTPESSKRFFGAIGFLSTIVFIAIWARDMTDLLLITSASLLGLESVTELFKKK